MGRAKFEKRRNFVNFTNFDDTFDSMNTESWEFSPLVGGANSHGA